MVIDKDYSHRELFISCKNKLYRNIQYMIETPIRPFKGTKACMPNEIFWHELNVKYPYIIIILVVISMDMRLFLWHILTSEKRSSIFMQYTH